MAETPTFVVASYMVVKYARWSRKSSLRFFLHDNSPSPTLPRAEKEINTKRTLTVQMSYSLVLLNIPP